MRNLSDIVNQFATQNISQVHRTYTEGICWDVEDISSDLTSFLFDRLVLPVEDRILVGMGIDEESL